MEFSWNHRKGNDTRKGNVCCVVNCDSKKNINTYLSFHKVPIFSSGTITVKNRVGESIVVDKRSKWVKRLKIQDTDQQILVCFLHFSVDDYVFPGSVTPKPQPGNPKPRVFRLLEDTAIINRYGFNSEGHEAAYNRLKEAKSDPHFSGIVGVNLGKNKLSEDAAHDYIEGLHRFSDVADYFVINVSSPNTPGLRDLQNKKNLEDLLTKVNETRQSLERQPPLLLKLAPDLSENERQDIADIVRQKKSKVDGLVISNTTVSRSGLKSEKKDEGGGLSGKPLTESSTQIIADMYRRTKGTVPIIGVGGIFTGNDAYDKIKAGASLVQIYTSFIFHGPPVVTKIKKELNDLILQDGYSSVTQAIGKNANVK